MLGACRRDALSAVPGVYLAAATAARAALSDSLLAKLALARNIKDC
jgi:hypothetical protein